MKAPVVFFIESSMPYSADFLITEVKRLQDENLQLRANAYDLGEKIRDLSTKAASPVNSTVLEPDTSLTPVSDNLCRFLGEPLGTVMNKSVILQRICNYARERNLIFNQLIRPDAPLRILFNLTENDELSSSNLNSYLKQHFPIGR
jgi:cell division septum initiation protein DivIVA